MRKKILFTCFLYLLIAGFSITNVMAYDPNWKEDQQKMFEQMQVKPGDVIDSSNVQKFKEFLPPQTYNWVQKGEFVLKVGEMKYDYSGEEAWAKATAANKGKYGLGKNKEVIEVSTGKYPLWLYGRPYPDIDLKNDPDAGIKFMHNKKVEESRPPTIDLVSETMWIGENGYERDFQLRWRRWYAWARPGGEVENPGHTKSFELTQLLNPYDLTGTVILTDSPLDGSGDKQYVYVPAIRRVKKQSGASRSDPSFGSDFVSDDASGWGGQAETMTWKVLGEQIALVPVIGWMAEHPDVYVKQPDGAWKTQQNVPECLYGWNDPNAPKGIAPWCPTNVVWVPRRVVKIQATPLDPYYNYGKSTYWFDKVNNASCYFKFTDDKAGEYWKAMIVIVACQEWGELPYKTFGTMIWHYVLDEKAHHASINRSRGKLLHGLYSDCEILGNGVKLEMMRPVAITTMTK